MDNIAPNIAKAIPVLPLVASTMIVSFLIKPFSFASCNIPRTARSFTLPPALYFSNFTYTLVSGIRYIGVFPIKSIAFFTTAIMILLYLDFIYKTLKFIPIV